MTTSRDATKDDVAEMAKVLKAIRHLPLAVVCRFCDADLSRGASIANPDHGNHLADCPVWKAAGFVKLARSETGDMKDALLGAKDLQIECMRIVLSLVSAKAGIESDVLVDMLKEAEERLTHEGQRTQ